MADQTEKEVDQTAKIQTQITAALAEIEKLRNTQSNPKNPNELEALERSIIEATDKLAGLITALKIQQAVMSEEIKAQSSALVANLPDKLKSQGIRLVPIQPGRGKPIEIAARYYSRKQNKKRKARKKNN